MRIFLCLLILLMPVYALAANQDSLYAYEMAEGMTVGAVFGQIPVSQEHDELISASSPVCDHIEIHNMSEVDGIMRMRKIPSLPFSKSSDAVLSAQGNHLMLIKMSAPLKLGQVIPLTLVFKQAGVKQVDVRVISRKAQ